MTDRSLPVSRGWINLLLFGLGVLGAGGTTTSSLGQVADAKADSGGTPTAETILRRTSDFFKQARSFAFEVERVQKIGETSLATTSTVDFQRPNRFAFR